jgi:AraC-like DNA-binding protein
MLYLCRVKKSLKMKKKSVYYWSFVLVLFTFLGVMTQCNNGQKNVDNYSDNVTVDSLKIWVYKWGEKMGEVPDSAIDHIDKFLLISEAKNKYADMAVAYKARQHYYQGQDDFPEAYRSALRRVDVAKLSNDSLIIRDAIYGLGRLLFRNGREYESLDYFLQLEKIDKTSDSRATLFFTLGQVYSVIQTGDDYKEMIARYYDLAEKETQKPDFTNTSIKSFIIFGRANLLIPYTNSDLYEFHPLSQSRIDSLNRAISLLKEIEYHGTLALCHAQLGQFAQAHQYEQKAFEASAGRPEDMRQTDYVRAIVRYREKNFNEAIKYASSNVEAYLALDDLTNAYMNMNILYYAYKTTGDTEKALYFLEQMRALDDKRIIKEKQDQVIISQIKYDSQLKDEEIREANRRNKEISFRNRIFGTVGVIFIILSIILYRLYSQKQKAYRGLYRQIKEQDRLAEELEAMSKHYDQMSQFMPTGVDVEVETHSRASLLPGNKQQRQLVSRLREFLLKDKYFATYDIDIQKLVPEMATNRTYLFEALKAVTGKTPMEFINYLRLDEAKRLLDNSDLTIETIAIECGFNTTRTFYNQFHERYRMTPAAYRRFSVEN